jgi:hypothetical protein
LLPNRRTDNAAVSGILDPVISRFATVVNVEPDTGKQCEAVCRYLHAISQASLLGAITMAYTRSFNSGWSST